jgi:hypothetical protein
LFYQFFQNRGQSLAVASTRGKELHGDGSGKVEYFFPEIPIGNSDGAVGKRTLYGDG